MTRLMLVLTLLAAVAGTADAQRGRGRGLGRGQPQDSMPNRRTLEMHVQQRLGQVMRERLGLNDEQMAKLQETNRKYDEKRRLLVEQERDVRMSLRDEVFRADSAHQGQIAPLLDRMMKVQRQRVELMEQEQRELSGFLTPLQRAKYFGTEEEMRRRVQDMRRQMQDQQMQRGQQRPPLDPNATPPAI